jgi:hypothetical protein
MAHVAVCDAHGAVHSSEKRMSQGEGYLLGARFVQKSVIQDKLLDRDSAFLQRLGITREQYRLQVEARQGATPWLICEQCVGLLHLSQADKDAAREAARRWWKDDSVPGHILGPSAQVKHKKPAYFMVFGNGFKPSDKQAQFLVLAWVERQKAALGADAGSGVRCEVYSRPDSSRAQFLEVIPEVQRSHPGQVVDDIIMLDQKTGKDMALVAVWAPEDTAFIRPLLKPQARVGPAATPETRPSPRAAAPTKATGGGIRIFLGALLVLWSLLTILAAWTNPQAFRDSTARWLPLFVFGMPGLLLLYSGWRVRRKSRAQVAVAPEKVAVAGAQPPPRPSIPPRPPVAPQPATVQLSGEGLVSATSLPIGACPSCHASLLSTDPEKRRIGVRPSRTKAGVHDIVCPSCGYDLTSLVHAASKPSEEKPATPVPAAGPANAVVPKDQPAQVEEVGARRYAGPPVSDLTQEGLLQELQKLGLSRQEAEASMQGALMMISVLDRNQINAIYVGKAPLDAKNLALKWAAHCAYHGGQIRGLHRGAAA